MTRVALASAIVLTALAAPADAMQTEVDPGTMAWKREGLARWVRGERKAAWLERVRQMDAASDVVQNGGPVPVTSDGIDWDAIAECESGGDWSYSGPGFYDGGLQFHPDTWIGAGGGQYAPYAYLATRAEQIAVASTLSLSAWPHCQVYA